MNLKFFDANVCFGAEMVNHEVVNHEHFIVLEKVEVAENAAKLVEYMDYAGIDRALTWHKTMYEQDPISGNAKIMQEIRGHEDRLLPTWTILPSITDSEFNTDTFFAKWLKTTFVL